MERKNRLFEEEIQLTVLGEGGWNGTVHLISVTGSIATVNSSRPIAKGALRLDCGYALVIGECLDCKVHKAQFLAQIAIQEIIPTSSHVARLMAAVCAATPRRVAASVEVLSELAPGSKFTDVA